jgi:hypothetical protein
MFGSKTKTCGHQATHPFRARCTKEAGHNGQHGARGLRWGADGRITFGGRKGTRR